MYCLGVSKQIKVSDECWEMLRKLAKKHRRTIGNTVEILAEDAVDAERPKITVL